MRKGFEPKDGYQTTAIERKIYNRCWEPPNLNGPFFAQKLLHDCDLYAARLDNACEAISAMRKLIPGSLSPEIEKLLDSVISFSC